MPVSLSKHHLLLAGCLFLGLHIAFFVIHDLSFSGPLSEAGAPRGADFITYWAASHLGLTGEPAAAYDAQQLLAAERQLGPVNMKHTAWYYPPTFMLLVLPLALMPYLQAYYVFVSLCGLAYLAALRRFLPAPEYLILLLAFPAVLHNVTTGQNGLLTTALAASALYWLGRRPVLAGICIGALCIKPQLAVLFPLMLVLVRAWHSMLSAALTTAICVLLSWVAFGTDTWLAFIDGMSKARHYLETDIPLNRMPTVFSALRLAGADLAMAYAGHLLIAALALAAMVQTWRWRADPRMLGAALVPATLLISPYLFDYDLAWLIIPMAWLVVTGARKGWLPGERLVLAGIWFAMFYPQVAALMLFGVVFQIGAVVNLGLLAVILRRARTGA